AGLVQVQVPARVWGSQSLLRHDFFLSLRPKPPQSLLPVVIFLLLPHATPTAARENRACSGPRGSAAPGPRRGILPAWDSLILFRHKRLTARMRRTIFFGSRASSLYSVIPSQGVMYDSSRGDYLYWPSTA